MVISRCCAACWAGVDAGTGFLLSAPHIPADWSSFTLDRLRVGAVACGSYIADENEDYLQISRTGSGDCTLRFSPPLACALKVLGGDERAGDCHSS